MTDDATKPFFTEEDLDYFCTDGSDKGAISLEAATAKVAPLLEELEDAIDLADARKALLEIAEAELVTAKEELALCKKCEDVLRGEIRRYRGHFVETHDELTRVKAANKIYVSALAILTLNKLSQATRDIATQAIQVGERVAAGEKIEQGVE